MGHAKQEFDYIEPDGNVRVVYRCNNRSAEEVSKIIRILYVAREVYNAGGGNIKFVPEVPEER